MVRRMLSVLMDGINDTKMLLDYATDTDAADQKSWFMNHAKNRTEQMVNDYAFIKAQLELDRKIAEGDDIAEALCSHLEHEITDIKNRINA